MSAIPDYSGVFADFVDIIVKKKKGNSKSKKDDNPNEVLKTVADTEKQVQTQVKADAKSNDPNPGPAIMGPRAGSSTPQAFIARLKKLQAAHDALVESKIGASFLRKRVQATATQNAKTLVKALEEEKKKEHIGLSDSMKNIIMNHKNMMKINKEDIDAVTSMLSQPNEANIIEAINQLGTIIIQKEGANNETYMKLASLDSNTPLLAEILNIIGTISVYFDELRISPYHLIDNTEVAEDINQGEFDVAVIAIRLCLKGVELACDYSKLIDLAILTSKSSVETTLTKFQASAINELVEVVKPVVEELSQMSQARDAINHVFNIFGSQTDVIPETINSTSNSILPSAPPNTNNPSVAVIPRANPSVATPLKAKRPSFGPDASSLPADIHPQEQTDFVEVFQHIDNNWIDVESDNSFKLQNPNVGVSLNIITTNIKNCVIVHDDEGAQAMYLTPMALRMIGDNNMMTVEGIDQVCFYNMMKRLQSEAQSKGENSNGSDIGEFWHNAARLRNQVNTRPDRTKSLDVKTAEAAWGKLTINISAAPSGAGMKKTPKVGQAYIDMDAFQRGQLRVIRDGAELINKPYDADFLKLYNSRYNHKHPYSKEAIELYRRVGKLIGAENMGVGRTSTKHKLIHGGRIEKKINVIIKTPKEAFDELILKIGSIEAGNDSPYLIEQCAELISYLQKEGEINSEQAAKLNKIIYPDA